MINFITRKLLGLVPMIFFISFLIYLGIEIMPGDAVSFLIPPDMVSQADPAKIAAMREALGLNDPFIVRYFKWLWQMLQGNFGYSLQSGVSVSHLLSTTVPATIELSMAALLFSSILGTILGMISALKKSSVVDNLLSFGGMIGIAIPQFILGLLMIIVFTFTFDWLPVGGRMEAGKELFFQRLNYLLMPTLALGLSLTAGVMRYTRSSMLDSLNKDFIKTARSKGLPEWRINIVHGLRVALTPVVVLIGFRLPILIGGAVIIEEVFQWPGVGKMFVQAAKTQDTPIIMTIAFFTVVLVLLASVLVDIFTAILDPRVKLS